MAAKLNKDGDNLPAIVIPREHQSAPAEHWAEKEIRLAAEEMAGAPILQPEDEHFDYGPTQRLAMHERVKEALAKLEEERDAARNTQEFLEKTQMLFEANAAAQAGDKWAGQERWQGRENEEMRIVNVLTPFQFVEKLERAGLCGRVELKGVSVLGRAPLLAHSVNRQTFAVEKEVVGFLQYPCGPEWMVVRTNESGVPTTAKYLGWRTCLLAMILHRVVSEQEAHRAFPLGLGPAGDWYREQLYVHRNRKEMAD